LIKIEFKITEDNSNIQTDLEEKSQFQAEEILLSTKEVNKSN
jgi:hypothetical protein